MMAFFLGVGVGVLLGALLLVVVRRLRAARARAKRKRRLDRAHTDIDKFNRVLRAETGRDEVADSRGGQRFDGS